MVTSDRAIRYAQMQRLYAWLDRTPTERERRRQAIRLKESWALPMQYTIPWSRDERKTRRRAAA